MKKILSILMILMLMMGMICVFSACSSDDAVAEDVPEEEVVEDEESEPDFYELETEIDSETDNDVEGIFLLKDDKYYSLEGVINNGYGIGVQTNLDSNILYSNNYEYNGQCLFTSYGRVPEPVMSAGDQVVAFSNNEIPSISLYKLDFYGYGLGLIQSGNSLQVYDPISGLSSVDGIADLEVMNGMTDEKVEDYNNLEHDEWYSVSWHEGTKTEKVDKYAVCSTYAFSNPEFDMIFSGNDYDYQIEGTLTNYGYATYDFSNIEPGLYKLNSGSWKGVLKVE